MIDSNAAQVIHDTIYVHSADALHISEQARSFFNDSFDKLILIIGIFGGAISIAIPYFITYTQRKKIRIETVRLLELENRILHQIDEKTNDVDNRAKGSIMLMLAITELKEGKFLTCYLNSLKAIRYFVKCNEHLNINQCFDILSELSKKNLVSKKALDDAIQTRVKKTNKDKDKDINNIIDYIKVVIEEDKEKIYEFHFDKLISEYNSLKEPITS